MTLTKEEREAGYKQPLVPAPRATDILRRIAGGYLIVTMNEDGSRACYDSGIEIMVPYNKNNERWTRYMTPDDVALWVKRGWLIPIEGETLFEDGPAQRYRARTVTDGPLPRIVRPDGNPLWAIPPE
jgi:hypothetical protein